MFIRSIVFSFFYIMAVFFLSANNNPTQSASVDLSILKHANKFLTDKRLHSVSVGVVKNGLVYTKHLGELTPNMGNTPNNNTIYEIGSVSKTMTGFLVAKAVKEGKLQLDVNINDYFPNPLTVLSPDNNPVTVRQLLTHSSGIPKELNIDKDKLSQQSFINSLNTIDTTNTKHQFIYSSAAIELLAYILETVYQTPFDSLLQNTLKQEAKMTSTKVNLTTKELNNFAYGYSAEGELMPAHIKKEVLWGGSGFIKSTFSDLTRYLQLQLNQNNSLVQLSQQKLLHISGTDSMSYLWIAVDNTDTKTHFVHHGGLEGTQNWLMVFPEYGMGISVITNSSFPQVAGMLKELALKIIDDIKPFGKKSLYLALSDLCQENVDDCLKKYQQLKNCCNNDYSFEKPNELNSLGYSLLNNGQITKAITVLSLLVKEFPDDANAYDSLADAYYQDKNLLLATSNFKKSLALNPNNNNAKNMIEKIMKND